MQGVDQVPLFAPRVLCSLEGEQRTVGVVVLGIMRWVLAVERRAPRRKQREFAAEGAR